MKRLGSLSAFVLLLTLQGCEIADNYTNGYRLKYRRPIGLLMSHELDELELSGKGVKVGVIDGGFGGFMTNDYTKHLMVRDYRDFIDGDTTGFFGSAESNHGTLVTTSIGGRRGERVHGLAFNAIYYLAKTEDVNSERYEEELRLTHALDWLVSLGVSVINISLGYANFDDHRLYTRTDLDGKTAISSRYIDSLLQVHPDLVITVSAGNDGDKDWKNITFPGDVRDVITVGSTDFNGHMRWESSGLGVESVPYIKPDVVIYSIPLGNSHSTPVITGLCAVLKELNPNLTRRQIIQSLHETSSLAARPNREMGYGVPNSRLMIRRLKQSEYQARNWCEVVQWHLHRIYF